MGNLNGNPRWRTAANPTEAGRVRQIDRELRRLAKTRSALARERCIITNRALQRAKYWGEKR